MGASSSWRLSKTTYLNEGAPSTGYTSAITMKWGEITGKFGGFGHPFMQVDVINDTPTAGNNLSATSVVTNALLLMDVKVAAPEPGWEFPMWLVSATGGSSPDWGGGDLDWNAPGGAAAGWTGGMELIYSASPVSVPIPMTTVQLVVDVTTMVQLAVEELSGLVQIVGSVPGGPGMGGTAGVGFTPGFAIDLYSDNETSETNRRPELLVDWLAGDSVGKLINKRQHLVARAGDGRLF